MLGRIAVLAAIFALVTAPATKAVESQVATFAFGEAPNAIAYGPGGSNLYTATLSIGSATDSVLVLDAPTTTLSHRISLGGPVDSVGLAISPDGRYAVVSEFLGDVAIVDLTARTVTTHATGATNGSGLEFRPGTTEAYIPYRDVNDLSNHVYVTTVDPGTATLTHRVIGANGDGRSQSDIAFTPSGGTALLGTGSARFLIDDLTTTTATEIDPGVASSLSDVAIDPSGRYGYVTATAIDAIFRVDLATHALTQLTLPAGSSPQDIAIDRTGDFAYTVDGGTSTVSKIDLSTFAIVHAFTVAEIGATSSPVVLATDPNRDRVAVGFSVGKLAQFAPGASAPTSATATAGDGEVALAFGPPASDNGASITGYQYSVDRGTWVDVSGGDGARSTTIRGLANGVEVSIRLRAVNAQGPGTATAAMLAKPQAPAASTPSLASASRPKFVNGALVTTVTVPGAGTLRQSGTVAGARKSKTTTICTTKATLKKAGKITLTCRLNKAGLARRKRGALTVTLTTVYTPTGGTAQTTTQKVKVARAKSG